MTGISAVEIKMSLSVKNINIYLIFNVSPIFIADTGLVAKRKNTIYHNGQKKYNQIKHNYIL